MGIFFHPVPGSLMSELSWPTFSGLFVSLVWLISIKLCTRVSPVTSEMRDDDEMMR